MRDLRRRQPFGSPDGPHPEPLDTAADPVEIVCDSVLCRLQVWNEAAWAALPESERAGPLRVEHVPGLGWVGAVPVQHLN
jgi:hypothetical protein